MDHQDSNYAEGIEGAIKGAPVSRRWFLRNSANAAAGTIAASAIGAAATAQAEAHANAASEHDALMADKPAGYVHSLHGWDTI